MLEAPSPQGRASGDVFVMTATEWCLEASDPIIRQHQVLGRPVMPFAAWLVKCVQAVTALHGQPVPALQQVIVRELIDFGNRNSLVVQFTSTLEGNGGGGFQ